MSSLNNVGPLGVYSAIFDSLKESGIAGIDKEGAVFGGMAMLPDIKTESFIKDPTRGFDKTGVGENIPTAIVDSFNNALVKAISDLEQNTTSLIKTENFHNRDINIPALKVSHGSSQAGGLGLTDAQYQAGILTALAGQNPRAWYEGSLSLSSDKAKAIEGYTSSTISKAPEIRAEAWSGQVNYDAIYYSIAINIMSARADDLSEIIYPTITINPKETGMRIEVVYTSFMTPYIRSLAGNPNKPEYLPLIKNAYNSDILGQERTLVVPNADLVDSQNVRADAMLFKVLKETTKAPGVTVTTAPYLVDKDIDILGVSQNDLTLANGNMDWTDSLTGSINLAKLFIRIDDNSSSDNIYPINTFYLNGSTFNSINQGNYKDLVLNLHNHTFAFTVNKTMPAQTMSTTKTSYPDSYADVLSEGQRSGYTYYFRYSVNGTVNIEDASCKVSQSGKIVVEKITDQNGAEIELTDGTGKTIVDNLNGLIDAGKIRIEAYELKAYRLNDNFRTAGQQLRVDSFSTYVDVGWKSGFSASGPIQNYAGDFNDITYIKNIAEYNFLISSNDGLRCLKETKEFLEAITSTKGGITPDIKTKMLGQLVVEPFYEKLNIEVGNIVEALESVTKMQNLRAAIINQLIPLCNNMYINSNYNVALRLDSMHADKKANIVIATHERVAQILCYGQESNVFSLTDKLNLIVVSTPNNDLENKMYLVFSVATQIGEVKEPNLLHHGIRAASPTLTIDLSPRTDGAVRREILTVPRWQHFCINPIMAYVTLSGNPDETIRARNVYQTKSV